MGYCHRAAIVRVIRALRADARFAESGGSSVLAAHLGLELELTPPPNPIQTVLAARLGFELKRLGWHLSTEALLRPNATMASAALEPYP
eukprot:scaffold30103_cov71-Phaeocystis_antarctica.AAC.1